MAAIVAAPTTVPSAQAAPPVASAPVASAVAVGFGGAVATVDAEASRAGIEVLRAGGNAVDAAVAAAATLGVTEPYSAGIGGGGFLVFFHAGSRRVFTLDGRETAPAAMRATAFIDPATGQPLPLADAVTSGLSVGVPGTPATWAQALSRWGTRSLAQVLQPAIRVADHGFAVDATFAKQTEDNADRFAHFSSTAALFLARGRSPALGSTLRNPDLARTYRQLARHGTDWFYRGALAREIVRTVQQPPLVRDDRYQARSGLMSVADLSDYRVILRDPTHVRYRGLDVYGMGPPSSGGSTVGEALNILSRLTPTAADPPAALQSYLESSRLAFADRNRYLGDPEHVSVPLAQLLSPGFAAERACLIDQRRAAPGPVPPGNPDGDYPDCPVPSGSPGGQGVESTSVESTSVESTSVESTSVESTSVESTSVEGPNTTHLVTSDQWGNVVAYTLTIEATGGSGIVVPGRGFLLNNELTDFTFAPSQGDAAPEPNLPAPGKRSRSSMAPTIILRDGQPFLALGSPGGATIITTVVQILLNRLDLGMTFPDAIAAPRASQRNTAATEAELEFLDRYETALKARGHQFTTNPELGAATGLEFLGSGKVLAVAEPIRRGGGSARVVHPSR